MFYESSILNQESTTTFPFCLFGETCAKFEKNYTKVKRIVVENQRAKWITIIRLGGLESSS